MSTLDDLFMQLFHLGSTKLRTFNKGQGFFSLSIFTKHKEKTRIPRMNLSQSNSVQLFLKRMKSDYNYAPWSTRRFSGGRLYNT